MIVKRIQVELRRMLSSTSVRVWLSEESENGYQQCGPGCAVTCAADLCHGACSGVTGRMALASLAPIQVFPRAMFIIFAMFIIVITAIIALLELRIAIAGVAGVRKKWLRKTS